MKQYLEIGKVNNTHGIKGEVKLAMWCDGISYIKQLKYLYLDDRGNERLTLLSVRQQKNIAILKFDGITSIEQAENLKNKILYCNRDDAEIDEDSYYLADIIGCTVKDIETGIEYGKIVDVMNYGAGDIYDVKNGSDHHLIPAIDEVVKNVDTANGIVLIKNMKGLFE